jgi:hypothetical protein
MLILYNNFIFLESFLVKEKNMKSEGALFIELGSIYVLYV